MQSDIREACLSCGICSQYHAERPTEPMLSHKIPSRPWSKISVDLFALDGKQYLVMVDHYSDYFELESLRNVAASTVVRAMKRNSRAMEYPTLASMIMAHNSTVMSSQGLRATMDLPWSSPHLITAVAMGKQSPQ